MTDGSRSRILDAAAELLRSGRTVSLESAARECGLSKPGLMYHFRTKEALMTGLVDHVVDGWERALVDRLGGPAEDATLTERIRAYVGWALSGEADESHLAMLSDPRLRRPLMARWSERTHAWLGVPEDLDPGERARLHAVRLLADGAWFADAAHCYPVPGRDREHVLRLAEQVLAGAAEPVS